MDKFKTRPNKEVDRGFIKRVIFCFSCVSLSLYIIYISTSGAIFTGKHLSIFILCAIPLSVFYAFAVEKLGSGLGNLLLGWTSGRTNLSEQYSADLSRARLSKGKKQFREALLTVNEILEKHPNFPEATLLKAQIVWEGYDNKELALRNLDETMRLVKNDNPIYRWALNYYHEVKKGRKPEK